jgi:metallo-beta-lactamase family protein
MQLEFFGAADEVTGSCHVLRVGDSTLLLDCGMVQGGETPEERLFGRGRDGLRLDLAAPA